MRTRLFLFLTLANLFLCAASAERKPPVAELDLIGFHATHTGSTLSFEGQVKNVGPAPARRVKLVFALLDANGKVVSTRRGPIDDEELLPGQEGPFLFESAGNADAVTVRVTATELDSRPAQLAHGGPYPLE